MTDFRAMCEELVETLDYWLKHSNLTDSDARELADRARAALAEQPVRHTPIPMAERLPGAEDCDEQPVEPTDDSDLLQFLLDNFRSRSLHMDGTAYYVLDTGWPFNHRSSNSRAFVEQAYHKSCEHFRKQS